MSVVTRRIYHISAPATTLLNTQMGVEDSNDSDLGFRMWVGRDDVGIGPQTGAITKFLAKDQAARVTEIEATTRVKVTDGATATGADITTSAAAFEHSGQFTVDAGGSVELKSGTDAAGITLHPSSAGTIRFIDAEILTNWTQKYCLLSNGYVDTAQYKTDFGEVSIFAALHACLSAGGSSAPDGEITYGDAAGTGIDSDSDFTWDDSGKVLGVAGRIDLENAAYGAASSAGFATSTITANFSTGKDIQSVNLSGNATSLSLTAPSGGQAKGLLLYVYANGSSRTVGGTGFSSVYWENSGPDLNTSGGAISMGATDWLILNFAYNSAAATWSGWVSHFTGPGI